MLGPTCSDLQRQVDALQFGQIGTRAKPDHLSFVVVQLQSARRAPRDAHQCVTNIQKRNKNIAENYRPVSLTSQCSKLMESIIRDAIVQHLEANQLLKDSQHGFRTGRSCRIFWSFWIDY